MVTTGELNQLSKLLKLQTYLDNPPSLPSQIHKVQTCANYTLSQPHQAVYLNQDVLSYRRVNKYLDQLDVDSQWIQHLLDPPSSQFGYNELLYSSIDDTALSVKFSSSFQIDNMLPSDLIMNSSIQIADDMSAVKATSTSQNTPTSKRVLDMKPTMSKTSLIQQFKGKLKRLRSPSTEDVSFQELKLKKLKES